MKNQLKRLDVYFPILFKLENDSSIIHSDLLEIISNRLSETKFNSKCFFTKLPKKHRFHYQLDSDLFVDFYKQDPLIKTLEVYAFYYHHRLIFYTNITYSKKNPKFRIIRIKLIELIRQLTNEVIQMINQTIRDTYLELKDSDKRDIVENAELIQIKTFYSYCIVFQASKNSLLKKNDQIETFNIRTLQPKIIPFFRTSLLRISIPNMTAYYSGRLSMEYTSEIINAVYKTVLYAKKIDELKITDQYKQYDYEISMTHQIINEEMIMSMWTYCVDSFGGKRVDQIGNKGAVLGLVFSLIALVFSIISLIQSL